MYTCLYKVTDMGHVVPVPNARSEIAEFFSLREAEATFMNALSLLTRWSAFCLPFYEKDFRLCLQFFNNIGMLLWYKDDKQLQDTVFHNVSFLISALQCLFQHDIQTELSFDPDTPGQRETDFNADVVTFTETGLLKDYLMQVIWEPLKLNATSRKILKHFLINLDLCYIDSRTENNSSTDDIISSSLRFPWFVSRNDEDGLVDREWPEAIPPLNVQLSLIYRFFHRVPPAIYERFCVRIQKHLAAQGHVRHDFKNIVYVAQNDLKVFIQKDTQPSVQLHLRCPLQHLSKLQPLMAALYQDFEELCAELPGLVLDGYLPCSHCLLKKEEFPTRRSTEVMKLQPNIDSVMCEGDRIPAALVYPPLLGELYLIKKANNGKKKKNCCNEVSRRLQETK